MRRRMRLGLLGVLVAMAVGLSGCATSSGQHDMVDRSGSKNRDAAEVNTQLAAGYMREGERKVAMEKIRRALAFDPGYAKAHHVHALLLDELGEEQEAAEAFRRAYRLDGDNPDLANNYAGFLCGPGEYDRAQSLFREAYSDPLYDTPEYALVNSARCYQRAGDETRALEQFRQAMDEGAANPGALLGLAEALYETGAVTEAAEAMRRYESRHRHTPRSLVMAIAIDKALGDDEALANHRLILRGRFPDSPEAQALKQGGS